MIAWLPYVCIAVFVASGVFIFVAYHRRWAWTGFTALHRDERQEDARTTKTLWDWLQLLLIPLVLTAAVFVLNQMQSDREHHREDRRAAAGQLRATEGAREEVLRTYLQQMSQLMLDRTLLKSSRRSEVRSVARTLTLTAVRRLDGQRKGLIVRFLLEARLINGDDPKVDLRNADLRHLAMQGTKIPPEATRLAATLRRSDPRQDKFTNANFAGADLRQADLRRANLASASFAAADLRGAKLSMTNLSEADLAYADLRHTDLRRVIGLADTARKYTTHDPSTQWPQHRKPITGPSKPQTTGPILVSASAIRETYNGFCPPPVDRAPYFKGVISVPRGPVTVQYQWLSSNGGSADPSIKTITFGGRGPQQQIVYFTERVWPSDTGGSMTDWLALYVRAPIDVESNRVTYSVTCTYR